MNILVAGSGCSRCDATERNVRKANEELHLSAEIRHEYDLRTVAQLGVRITPAVLVDGKIVASGRVPTVEELKALLAQTH